MREKESFNVSADDLCQVEGINDIKNARKFFLRMKATNTCNRNAPINVNPVGEGECGQGAGI